MLTNLSTHDTLMSNKFFSFTTAFHKPILPSYDFSPFTSFLNFLNWISNEHSQISSSLPSGTFLLGTLLPGTLPPGPGTRLPGTLRITRILNSRNGEPSHS